MRLEATRRVLRFAEPLPTAHGTLTDRSLVEVTVTAADGATGRGEAAPLQPYDGVSLGRAEQALAAHARALRDHDRASGATVLDACREADALPQALAAVDMALWDLAGRREGRPVAALLADEALDRVAVNASIGALEPADAAAAAAAAAHARFPCVKVKVGHRDDLARVRAVRSAIGPDIALRVDANGAWTVGEAVRAISALAACGLELVEEPVHGIAEMRAVRERVSVPLAIDETASLPGGLAAPPADLVCLKVAALGGISALLAAAALVRASGAEVYLASSYDGPLGIAAAVHAAAALRVSRPCGLATLALFDEPPPAALRVTDGGLRVPSTPGLAV